MDTIAAYEFDRQGFLVLPGLLAAEQVRSLSAAVDELEAHALAHLQAPPRKLSLWGPEYHRSPERGYHAWGSSERGKTLMIEDFFNASPAFDPLVNHPGTMACVRSVIQGPPRINNSEIRIRYPGNFSGTHMGGPLDHKYRYGFNQRGIDCMMVRMIYFLHDVGADQGPFCVVPGSHKSNFPSPYRCGPDEEPGMVGLEARAGDGIFFTENLRHGGFTNRSEQPRKTLHVGYGPVWMMSQNIATMDEPQYVLPETLARYDEEQRRLFVLGKQQGK